MFDALMRRASDLRRSRVPYALAIVVRHEKPISGKPGDKAIILADGALSGWIGGGCTKPLIIEEARQALVDGKHRLVRIAPSVGASARGIVEYTMTCHSGGSLDIYIEPVLPPPQLIILGRTELARTLCRLGKVMQYEVVAAAPDADASQFPEADDFQDHFDLRQRPLAAPTFIIVATQGERDVEALTEALASKVPYVAFIASRKKAQQTLPSLEGFSPEDIARIRTPAGLDIGARLPNEIAVSILAEIISVLRTEPTITTEEETNMLTETVRIDGMSCSHCVLSVRKALENMPGVTIRAVEVGSARISYDEAQVSGEHILQAIEDQGYSARQESA